jgi:hypothetical protein
MLKEKGIRLKAKPPGRPSASAVPAHVSPGERNPVEGKFGQARPAYGLDRIRARLKGTSQSWIAGIIPALNPVKPAGAVALCFIMNAGVKFFSTLAKVVYFYKRENGQYVFLTSVRV